MAKSLGHALIQAAFPKGYKLPDGPISKKELNAALLNLAKKDPVAYVDTVTKVKRFGDSVSTFEGISAGLDDIEPAADRNAVMVPIFNKIKATKDPVEKQRLLREGKKAMTEVTKSHPGDMGLMARSGGRGTYEQLSKTVTTPFIATNYTGAVIPWAIHHAYSEGLTPSEAWTTGDESRSNAVKTKLSVTEPGEVGKLLLQNMYDQVVSSPDCLTSNGIVLKADDSNILDRYLAHATGHFKAGTLITSDVAATIRKHEKPVVVRSPITCKQEHGLCQKCYGLTERGELPSIGWNMGIRSAQAVSEPLTQIALSSKHGGQSVDEYTAPQGLKGVKQLIEIPESFEYGSVLSKVPGKVSHIEVAPQGGHYVHVGDETHYVPPGRKILVNKGDTVESGDSLSEGIAKPDELVALKGLGVGRKSLADSLYKMYKDQDTEVDKRHLELLSRSAIRYATVDHDPGGKLQPGTPIDYALIKQRLAEDAELSSLHDAVGHTLADDYLHFSAGSTVTPSMIKELHAHDVKNVQVSKSPMKVSFFMKPIAFSPTLLTDWLAKLGHRGLKGVIENAAQTGEKANIHSYHPIPALAYGSEFGHGEKGKY